jgi:hypothetical protein
MNLSRKGEGNMRKLFTTKWFAVDLFAIALMLLVAAPAAMAQTGSGAGGSSGAANQSRQNPDAPVGHRQPRADQIPSEKNGINPNDPLSKENAALDRKIKGICRGC